MSGWKSRIRNASGVGRELREKLDKYVFIIWFPEKFNSQNDDGESSDLKSQCPKLHMHSDPLSSVSILDSLPHTWALSLSLSLSLSLTHTSWCVTLWGRLTWQNLLKSQIEDLFLLSVIAISHGSLDGCLLSCAVKASLLVFCFLLASFMGPVLVLYLQL